MLEQQEEIVLTSKQVRKPEYSDLIAPSSSNLCQVTHCIFLTTPGLLPSIGTYQVLHSRKIYFATVTPIFILGALQPSFPRL